MECRKRITSGRNHYLLALHKGDEILTQEFEENLARVGERARERADNETQYGNLKSINGPAMRSTRVEDNSNQLIPIQSLQRST